MVVRYFFGILGVSDEALTSVNWKINKLVAAILAYLNFGERTKYDKEINRPHTGFELILLK